jgi:DNA-directed RNA polymerase specialized sigma24 family protein
MGWDEDACGEFYLFFHPRLVRLLDRFRDQGKPFESYLCAVLTWQLRNFARDRKRSERSWDVGLRIEPGAGIAPAPECPSTDDPSGAPWRCLSEIAPIIRTAADRRNFLFLILKCARTLEQERIGPLASLAGVAPERLSELSAELCRLRAPRDERLDTLRCRRNRAFSQVRLLESDLLLEMDPARREEISRRLARVRRRMRLAMARMARVGLAPTNREIALTLGVPKGTVDSGLFWLKRKLAAVYDPHNFRSA